MADDSKTEDSETKETSAKLLKLGFLGFSSNRFGRTLDLAETFVQHRSMIQKFYDEQVDQNQNKLFLACYAYLQSRWFNLCCDLGARLNKTVVIPLKAALGIDSYKHSKSDRRSWSGMKQTFVDINSNLSKSSIQTPEMSGSELLEAEICAKVQSSVKHQLDYMQFYKDDTEEGGLTEATLRKMEEAPLTNSGCESNFAQLDLECRRVGGGNTTLQTMSQRHIVKTNKYFNTEDWKNMETDLKNKAWKQARSSDQAKIVRSMQKDFLDKVKASEALANQEKIRRKLMKNEKCLKLLEEVKLHGGPVSPNDLHKLEGLTEAEVLKEVRYLRQTIAPNIREKRKVEKKFVKFSKLELIQQIKSALRPENEELGNIEILLKNSAKEHLKSAEKDSEDTVDEAGADTVALFEGFLGERKIGVVISKDTVQFYHLTRYGFQPDDLTSVISDWKLVEQIDDYDYISRRTGVYLRCSVSKLDVN